MITRWDPIRELADLHSRVNSIFEQTSAPEGGAANSFVPPVDVYEDENSIVLKLEAPGREGRRTSTCAWRTTR